MYDAINFTHETNSASRTCLEWEGKFRGKDIAGTTVLAFDDNGLIESIRLYHRPYEQVIAYSAELAAVSKVEWTRRSFRGHNCIRPAK